MPDGIFIGFGVICAHNMAWSMLFLWTLVVGTIALIFRLDSSVIFLLLVPIFIAFFIRLTRHNTEAKEGISTNTKIRKLNFAPDKPIIFGGDELNRSKFVKVVAEKINSHDASDGLVIGLHAPWGAGKTSFINLLTHELNDCEVIRLEPWAFADINQIFSQLFDDLNNVAKKCLNDSQEVEEFEKLIPYLELAVAKSSELPLPFVSKIFLGITSLFLSVKTQGSQIDQIKNARDKASSILRKIKKNIVVIIDDLDRLESEEVKQILKLIKASGDFSNVIYLLPCDRKIITRQISYADGGIDGSEYLKKIIQVDLSLPITDKEFIYKVLYRGLDEVLQEVYGEGWNFSEEQKKRWNEIFHWGFKKFFQTIRDCHRYLNAVRVTFSCVSKDDVDPVDFLAIEALRVFSPEYYDFISANKDMFVIDPWTFRKKEYLVDQFKNSGMPGVPKDIKGTVTDVTIKLFPEINEKVSVSDNQHSESRRQNLICSEKFDFYFSLDIPFGEVSDLVVKNFLSTLNDLDKSAEYIADWLKNDQIDKALKAIPFFIDNIQRDQFKILIGCLWTLEKATVDKRSFFNLEDVETLNNRIIWQGIKKLAKDNRKSFIQDIFTIQSELYPKTRLAQMLKEDAESFATQKTSDESILNIADAEEIMEETIKEVESALEDGELIEQRRALYLLYRLKERQKDTEIKKYLMAVIASKGLPYLIGKFKSRVNSTAGDYDVISVKELRELLGAESLEEEVKKINVESLTEDDKKIMDIYNKSLTHPWF